MSNQVPALARPAPSFRGTAVVDGQFKEISLDEYKGKYLVLFFYPLDFTFVCPTEIIAFSERADEFRKHGCEVVACSTDSHFSHLAWYVVEIHLSPSRRDVYLILVSHFAISFDIRQVPEKSFLDQKIKVVQTKCTVSWYFVSDIKILIEIQEHNIA